MYIYIYMYVYIYIYMYIRLYIDRKMIPKPPTQPAMFLVENPQVSW